MFPSIRIKLINHEVHTKDTKVLLISFVYLCASLVAFVLTLFLYGRISNTVPALVPCTSGK